MKNKALLIITIIFFLTVNTSYYWEGKLGNLAFPAFLLLAIVYFGLGVALLSQIICAFKEKLKDKTRLFIIGFLTLVLTLTFFYPFGLINNYKIEGGVKLIAEGEGAANCRTTLILKEDFTFCERNVCFSVTETIGKYHLLKDTIYFDKVELGRNESEFFMYAVIKPSKYSINGKNYNLTRFMSLSDTIGQVLWITKNELQ